MPDVAKLMQWEQGEMSTIHEVVDLFQPMIDSGVVWQLQGIYGRTARDLIEDGYCTDTHGVFTTKE